MPAIWAVVPMMHYRRAAPRQPRGRTGVLYLDGDAYIAPTERV